jgi:glycosyltransferase involved in cell wall biosynthesis
MYASLRPHIVRLHREFPFDIILAAWVYPDATAAAHLARDYRCPLVVKVLGSDINEIAHHDSLRAQIGQTLTQAQRILAVSNALKERVIDLGIPREKVVMHHNGVNGDQFTVRDAHEVRQRLGLRQDRKLVCYVGNLKPEKGVDVLIEAMGCLHREGNREIEAVMVGSGSMDEALRGAVRRGRFEDRVHFVGRKLHAEIPDWIAACDVFCLPSRREGCPNVVLEGLASGRPVVATAVGGVPELINADNGILVPSEQPEALAAALKAALSRKWDPTALRQSVESLSWDEIGRALHGVLEDSLAEYRAPSTFGTLTTRHAEG